MKELKELRKLIDKYHKLVEKGNFKAIEKLVDEGDILSACIELFDRLDGGVMFETKGFDSPGYDISSYVFTWIEKGEIQGVVLNIESY